MTDSPFFVRLGRNHSQNFWPRRGRWSSPTQGSDIGSARRRRQSAVARPSRPPWAAGSAGSPKQRRNRPQRRTPS